MENSQYLRKTAINGLAEDLIQILVGISALFFGAFIYIYIPGNPVPITLQVFSVLLIASLLKRKNSLLATTSYMVIGAFGLPVFAGATGGILHLFGPTGGYLSGFLAATFLIPIMKEKISLLYSLLIGLTTIYILGSLQLALYLHLNIIKAVYIGVLPFLPYDVIKLTFAYLLTKTKRGG